MKQVPRISALIGITLLLSTAAAWAQSDYGEAVTDSSPASHHNGKRPNILFIIMDDVGIDQLSVFGYGGLVDPAKTPNIDAIAHGGVRFRNVWAMPECSPSRAMFFEGRYPLRTNVYGALLDDDLANSQVSPYEYTTPRLLKTRGYDNGEFGKFHLGQVNHNPFGNDLVHSLGWDYFDGFLDGAPHPIDPTAGGETVAADGTHFSATCGFIPNKVDGGADNGSCRFVDDSCQDLAVTAAHPTPGRYCLEQGGVFVPNNTCQQPPNPAPNFGIPNGYYVWPRIINRPDEKPDVLLYMDPRARGFVGEATTNSAVSWIKAEKSANKSWMATVALPQIHAPYQQVPQTLLPSGSLPLNNLNCTGNLLNNLVAYHLLSNQMLESMDTEIGHLLVQTGLAVYNPDGTLNYQPQNTNTMVVLIGDNGTYAPGVRLPFNPARAKAFVYQTGVWVPLVIAGPMVSSPDREVESMVNVADLFQLFGEIAGIDVRRAVPSSHILDSAPMLGYLTNPNQQSIRKTNFTQTGNNIHLTPPSPCLVRLANADTCAQLFTSQVLCNDEGGEWYGPNSPVKEYSSCCAIKKAIDDNTFPNPPANFNILPDFQNAIRNSNYKLVQIKTPDCDQPPVNEIYPDKTIRSFYPINQASPVPMLDNRNNALCGDLLLNGMPRPDCPTGLTQDELANYASLSNAMEQLLMSEPACEGDGNEDKVVNGLDIKSWRFFAQLTDGGSSWSDANLDGKTDPADLMIIRDHLGERCFSKK